MGSKTLTNPIPLSWISACGQYRVTISEACIKEMLTLANRHAPNEIGTSVFGCYSVDGFHATILGNAPVAPDSKGERFSFRRGSKGARSFFLNLFRISRGERHYVGEWHSHPGGIPSPSHADDGNQDAIANDPQTNCPECILVIIAGNFRDDASLGVFVYSRKKGRIDLHPKRGAGHARPDN